MGWRGTDLQVEEDPDFQRRDWQAERVAWAAFAAVIVAALLGVFSTGPLSWAQERSASGELVIRYERFSRRVGESTLTASIRPDPGASSVALVISSDYFDANEIEVTTSPPTTVVFVEDGVRYGFGVEDPSRPVEVEFHVKPQDLGVQRFEFSVPGGEPVQVWQLMYP